jgi:hypothetical protein
MISFRQADLMKKVEEDRRSIVWTLVFYKDPVKGDSVDSWIKLPAGIPLSSFMMHMLVTIQSYLERSWDINAISSFDADKYAYKVPAFESDIYKRTADGVGNTLQETVPYFYRGKIGGERLPTGAVYAVYKIKDAKFPAGSSVKFKYDGVEFPGVVVAVLGDGSYQVKVDENLAAELADHNVANPVTLHDGEDWLSPQ